MALLVTASGAATPSLGLFWLLRLHVLLACGGGEVVLATQSPLTVLVGLVLSNFLSAGRPDCFGSKGLGTRLTRLVGLGVDQTYGSTTCRLRFLAFRSTHGGVFLRH